MNKINGPECGFITAKKIATKMAECEKYKDMMFDNVDMFGIGI